MKQRFWMVLILGLCLISGAQAASACGGTDACALGDRRYFITMPPGHDGTTPVPAMIFLHGYKGNGLGSMKWKALQAAAFKVGAALITPESKGDAWSMNNSPEDFPGGEAEELAYFDALKADVTTRFAVDPDRLIVVGASAGGMAAWMLACQRSGAYAGFVPMSGTFWAPVPPTCKGQVANIVHIHGDADTTVPLEGRAIGSTRQGSVTKALEMYRAYGGFGEATEQKVGNLACARRTNATGALLAFCLFHGGHSFSPAHMVAAWAMLHEAGHI
jgi:polyhydroxybutyrate depolymerase